MLKKKLQVQGIEIESKANVPNYIPFINDEIVTGACFDTPTGYVFKIVENSETIASADKDFKSTDLGNIKTYCLVVTTTKDTLITILTLNK